MAKQFYIPEGISTDYKYIVPSNDYYDLYNTNYLQAGHNYTYYRFYYDLEQDLYTANNRTQSQYNDTYLNCIEINPSSDYIYRRDYPDILFCSSIIIIALVILFNLVTTLIRRNGVLSGLI